TRAGAARAVPGESVITPAAATPPPVAPRNARRLRPDADADAVGDPGASSSSSSSWAMPERLAEPPAARDPTRAVSPRAATLVHDRPRRVASCHVLAARPREAR